ncbi:MAG TPA: ABC transporter permease [Gemmatimonadales bacterium]
MNIGTRLQSLFEGVVIALDAIRSNKVRAGLTILGIAVGVFVVTAMSAAVHGINAGVADSMAAAGPTTFYVTKWPAQINTCTGSADSCPWRRNPAPTIEEVQRINRLPSIRGAIGHVNSSAAVKFRDQELPGVGIDAYSYGWNEVDGGTIERGRSFTASEHQNASHVIIVNEKMAERLFGETDPVGKEVSVSGSPYLVVGVYKPVANVFEGGNNSKAIVPLETARRRLNVTMRWMDMTVKPHDGVRQDVAIDEVIAELRASRGLRPAEENTFFVTTQEKVLELYNSIVGAFFLVMIVLSAIGLIVGGVGVVAIMMISVTERTREIGVRKALGATRGTILWQFLVEAATLTLIGAMTGLVVGGGLTWLIRSFTPIQASIQPVAVVLALGASALTGVLFGMLPAARAARLDPVEALRYE